MSPRSEPVRSCEGRWHIDTPRGSGCDCDTSHSHTSEPRRSVASALALVSRATCHVAELLIDLADTLVLLADAIHDRGAQR